MYRIILYKTSRRKEIVSNFIDSFSNKIIDKIRIEIEILKEHGLSLLTTSKIKKITSYPNLYELRIKSSVQLRLFFVFVSPNIFLLVHGFIKKTNKTPIKEIRTAIGRIKEFDI